MEITASTLLHEAAALVSIDNDNPEYDRALAELVCGALEISTDHKAGVLAVLRALNGHVTR